jgi:hypothetical protein
VNLKLLGQLIDGGTGFEASHQFGSRCRIEVPD